VQAHFLLRRVPGGVTVSGTHDQGNHHEYLNRLVPIRLD